RPLDQDEALVGVDRVDRQALDRHALVAHAACHPHPLEHAAGAGAAADRAGLAVVAVGTVGGTHTAEAVALHHAGVALALARTGDVDDVTGGEHLRAQLLADLVVLDRSGTQLRDVATGCHAGLVELA